MINNDRETLNLEELDRMTYETKDGETVVVEFDE